jgi:hypothetical protein
MAEGALRRQRQGDVQVVGIPDDKHPDDNFVPAFVSWSSRLVFLDRAHGSQCLAYRSPASSRQNVRIVFETSDRRARSNRHSILNGITGPDLEGQFATRAR